MLRLATPFALLASLLALPAAASAHHVETVERSQPFALAYWQERGFDQCDGLEVAVEYTERTGVGYTRFVCGPSIGNQNDEPPTIGFHPALHTRDRWEICAIVVHEYGHLVGLKHSDEHLYPVMNGSGVRSVNECLIDWDAEVEPPVTTDSDVEPAPDATRPRCQRAKQRKVRRLQRRARRQVRRDHRPRARVLRQRAQRVKQRAC